MNFKNYFMIMVFLHVFISHAQTPEKKNKIQIGVGYHTSALKNLDFAPVSRYNYSGVLYKVNYIRTTKKNNLLEFEFVEISSKLLSDEIPVLNTDYGTSRFYFTYLKRVQLKDNFSFYLGPQFHSILSGYLIGKELGTYLEFQQKIAIASKFLYQINKKNRISTKVTLPFLLLVLGNINNEVLSLKNYQGMLWDSRYTYKLSEIFDLNFNYTFVYDRINYPHESMYREVQYQFTLGINYKF